MNCLERVPEGQMEEVFREIRINTGSRNDGSQNIEGNKRHANSIGKDRSNSSASVSSSPSLSCSSSMSQDSPSESSSREIQNQVDQQQQIKRKTDNSIDEHDENTVITPSNSKKRRQVIYETLSDDSDGEQPNNVKTTKEAQSNQIKQRTMGSSPSSAQMPQDQQNIDETNDQLQQQQDKGATVNSDQQIYSEDSNSCSNNSSSSSSSNSSSSIDNLERKSNQDIQNQNDNPKLLEHNEAKTPNKSAYVGRFEESMKQLEARYQASHEIKQTFLQASELLAMKSTFPKQSSSAALSPCESSRRRGITLDSYLSQDPQTPKQQRDISLLEKPSLTDADVQEYVLRVMKKKQKNPKEKCVIQRILSSLGLFSEKSRLHLLFNSVTTDILFENLTLDHFQKHEVIFNLGEFGNKYYIIVRGGAHLLLPSMGSRDANVQSELSFEKDESVYVKFMHRMQNLEDLKNKNQTENNKLQTEGKSVQIPNKHQKIKSPREIPIIPTSVVAKDPRQQPKKVYLQGCRYFKRLKDHLRYSSTQLSTEKDFVLLFGGVDAARQSLINSYYLDDSKKFVKCFFPSMQLYKTFLPSEAFGEIALLTKQRRTATMLCSAETFCLSLSKQGFDQIIGVYQKALIQQQVNFLMQFSFLEKIPKSKILSILLDMKPLKCQKNQIIYKEGDLCEYFYFIKEGDFEISKVETETAMQGREVEKLNEETNNFQEMSSRNSVFENQKRNSNTAQFFVFLNRSKQLKIEKKMKKKIPLIILSANRFFGQNEILREISFRQTTATCISIDGKLFTIPKNILLHHLQNWDGLDDLKRLDHMINAWSYNRFNSIIKLKQKDSIENNSSNSSKMSSFRDSLSSSSRNSTTTAGISQHFLRKNYLKKNTYNEYSFKSTNMNSSNKQTHFDSVSDKQLNKLAGQFHKSVCLQSSPFSSIPFDRCKQTNRENNFIKNKELDEFNKTACRSSNHPMMILETNEKQDQIGSLKNGNIEPTSENNDGLSNEEDTTISRFSSSCASPKNFSRFRSYHPLQPSLQIDLNNQGQNNSNVIGQLIQYNCQQKSTKGEQKDWKLLNSQNRCFQEIMQSNNSRNHRDSEGLHFQEDFIYYPQQEDSLGHDVSYQKHSNSLNHQNNQGNTKKVYVNPFFFAGETKNKDCVFIQKSKLDGNVNSSNYCYIQNQKQLGLRYLNTSNSSICNSSINMSNNRSYLPQNQQQQQQQQSHHLPQITYGRQRNNNANNMSEDTDKMQHELEVRIPNETEILKEFRQSSPFMKLQEVKETLSLKKHYLQILNSNSPEQPEDYLAAFFNIKSSKTMLLKVKAQASLQNNSVLNSHRPSQLLNISNLHRKAQKLYSHKSKKMKVKEGKEEEDILEEKCFYAEGRILKNNTKNLSLKISDKIKLSQGNNRESADVAVNPKPSETNAQRKRAYVPEIVSPNSQEKSTLLQDYLDEQQEESSIGNRSNLKDNLFSKQRKSNGAQTEDEKGLLFDSCERLKGQSSLALILGNHQNIEILQSEGKQKHHRQGILGYKHNIIQRIQLKEQQYYLARNKPSGQLHSPKQNMNGFNSTNLSRQSLECLSAGPTGSIHNNIYTSIMQKILSKTQTQEKTTAAAEQGQQHQ